MPEIIKRTQGDQQHRVELLYRYGYIRSVKPGVLPEKVRGMVADPARPRHQALFEEFSEIVPKIDPTLPVEHITRRSSAKTTKSGRIRASGGHAHSQLLPMLEEIRVIQQSNPQARLAVEKTFFPDQRDADLVEWLATVRDDGFKDPTYLERSTFGGWNVQKVAVDGNGNRILVEMGIGPASRDAEFAWQLTTVFPRHGDKVVAIDTMGEVLDKPWRGGRL